MTEQSDRKPKPRPRSGKPPREAGNDAAMGAALRSVYQETVEESVPDEFLDLLGKLG